MKIGIIGGGVVGRAVARTYLEWAEVKVYDVVRERTTGDLTDALVSDLIFICLPENSVEAFFKSLENYDRKKNFILRSTVPVGFTRHLAKDYDLPNLVHSPEFLTARCAVTDAQLPARNIIGIPKKDLGESTNWQDKTASALYVLYRKRFPGVPVYLMTSDESEAVKLITNAFFAVKVAYFNEARYLCDKLGLDWGRVLDGVLSDGRIAQSHTRVPGPDGNRGFGGACLPKDLDQLISCIQEAGLPACMTWAARKRNRLDRGKE